MSIVYTGNQPQHFNISVGYSVATDQMLSDTLVHSEYGVEGVRNSPVTSALVYPDFYDSCLKGRDVISSVIIMYVT
jgi:hypothetical protein